jgi:phage-related protein
MTIPVLLLPIAYNFNFQTQSSLPSLELGDGYSLSNINSINNGTKVINVTAFIKEQTKLDEIVGIFTNLKGRSPFQWQPSDEYPIQTYYCESWNIQWNALALWTLSATFQQD